MAHKAGARAVVSTSSLLVEHEPLTFVKAPFRWLQASSHLRITTAGGPYFGYELCRQRVKDAQRQALDLASWRVAFCGAEPVRAQTFHSQTNLIALTCTCGDGTVLPQLRFSRARWLPELQRHDPRFTVVSQAYRAPIADAAKHDPPRSCAIAVEEPR